MGKITDYGHPVRKLPSLDSRKSTPTPKFSGTAEAYFVCHIGPNFRISLIYAFIGCPWVKSWDLSFIRPFLFKICPIWIFFCPNIFDQANFKPM